MQNSMKMRFIRNSFWLSVLLHILLFLSFTTVIFLAPAENQKAPTHYVPAFVYKGAITPSAQSKPRAATKMAASAEREQPSGISATPSAQTAALTANTESINKSTVSKKNPSLQKSILSATQDVLQEEQRRVLHVTENVDPIYLVGDENQVADPLIKLMGQALSAHFDYPKVEGELGIKGRVIVDLTLHPEGYFSNVQILKSSDNQSLDAAALYAINAAPKVMGADRFISEPKHFVIGFLFR